MVKPSPGSYKRAIKASSRNRWVPFESRVRLKDIAIKNYQKLMGGFVPRWLIVESQLRRESDLKNLEKKIQKERAEVDKKLRTLKSEKFACIPDAETATRKLLKKFLDHEIKQINVQFVESKFDTDFPCKVQVEVGLRESKIELETKHWSIYTGNKCPG